MGSLPVPSTETLKHPLSGTSPDDGVTWQFAEGLFADSAAATQGVEWSTIRVPSNWELEGFGTYSYGRGPDRRDEERKKELSDQGTYRHVFEVPAHLKLPESYVGPHRRHFFLEFEGVMTDTRVFLNGTPIETTDGDLVHRGGFTPFSYEVTDLLDLEGSNELVVAVRETSSNRSIDAAERDADYWLFGGIFRPVHLVSRPEHFIESVAVDAQADGSLRILANVRFDADAPGLPAPEVHALVRNTRNPRDLRVIAEQTAKVEEGVAELNLRVPNRRPWSAETPNLYSLELRFNLHHSLTMPIGFRTVEVRVASRRATERSRESTGLFINGERVILRGINRHSFWPTTGRALTPERNRRDVELIKSLGFNAVRSSHYPPDQVFLEACDELGLYVIDELPGWHTPYDKPSAQRLARAMVLRDRNHPSILFWANGNEGGWNPYAEPVFRELDLYQRRVIRPDSIHGGFDTRHYPSWDELEVLLDSNSRRYRYRNALAPAPLILFTEMLHGLYDGGSAASLDEYWQRLSASPRFAGGFLWALLDEGVVRLDQPPVTAADGSQRAKIDSFGNYGPDGIVGPFREPSASSRGIPQIFGRAPKELPKQRGSTEVAVNPELLRFDLLKTGSLAQGDVTLSRSWSNSDLPDVEFVMARGTAQGESGITRFAANGEVLPLKGGRWVSSPNDAEATGARLVGELFESWTARGEHTETVGQHRPWNGHQAAPGSIRYTQTFAQPDHAVRWTLDARGVTVEVKAELDSDQYWAGLQFDLPRDRVRAFEWSGLGPDRIWRNRLTGRDDRWRAVRATGSGRYGEVQSLTNGTRYQGLSVEGVYYLTEASVELDTGSSSGGTMLNEGSPTAQRINLRGQFVGFLQPTFPEDAGFSAVDLPPGLTFYLREPGIGSRFYPAHHIEPVPAASLRTLEATFLLPARPNGPMAESSDEISDPTL